MTTNFRFRKKKFKLYSSKTHLNGIDLTESVTNETDFNTLLDLLVDLQFCVQQYLSCSILYKTFFFNENNEFLCLAFHILNNTTTLHDAF